MSDDLLPYLTETSMLFSGAYMDAMLDEYLEDASSVPEEWAAYFKAMGADESKSHVAVREGVIRAMRHPHVMVEEGGHDFALKVSKLVQNFKHYGHIYANTNPIADPVDAQGEHSFISLERAGLSEHELIQALPGHMVHTGAQNLNDLYQHLKKTFLGSIGFEYSDIENPMERQWFDERVHAYAGFACDEKKRKRMLQQLMASEEMEHFLGRQFVGQTRFSIEGADALIPLVNEMIAHGAASGALQEVRLGHAHRGRISVMVNVLGMPFKTIFDKFTGAYVPEENQSGDVIYHLGHSSDRVFGDQQVHVSLAANPSHLEFIGPVVMGICRARQETLESADVLPIILHGDAAVSGQGVTAETINMSMTEAHSAQGNIHVIINNQVGFTNGDPNAIHAGRYPTDVFKMLKCPILHVNADDPDAIAYVAELAIDYRSKFQKSVIIELLCYRRYGHNEADDPTMTQALMYQKIKKHPTVVKLYATRCIEEGVCDQEWIDAEKERINQDLKDGAIMVETAEGGLTPQRRAMWSAYLGKSWDQQVETRVKLNEIKRLGKAISTLPEGFTPHRLVGKLMQERADMVEGKLDIRWGMAELLAYASLVEEGYKVRLIGQDVERGTFSHRHAMVTDQVNEMKYNTLSGLGKACSASFQAYNSVLSEQSVLGFEYGYAITDPKALVIWEAQYGDFSNGAQVMFDQFISSSWQKWGLLCGVVMFLPHGYEGKGPEHSSARLERYLQLCAQENISVCVPSTAGQIFHLLRRQMIRSYRTPLVVMTPKSLLRHPGVGVDLKTLTQGSFQLVMPDAKKPVAKKVKRLILCSGKIYHELDAARDAGKYTDVALLRIEQLYPFPTEAARAVIGRYTEAKTLIWCQEEPENQGAWRALRHHFEALLQPGQSISYVGRPPMAAPSTGYKSVHSETQQRLIEQALGHTHSSK